MTFRLDHTLLVVAAAVAALSRLAAAACGDAACTCLQSTMTCRGQSDSALPSISAVVTAAYFTKYQITTLDNSSFVGQLQQLTKLSLETNGIVAIERHAFAGLPALQYLSLSSNSIDQLPEQVFKSLGQLRELYVGENVISRLSADVFVGLGNLRKLDLSNNLLSALPSAAYRNLTSLGELDLSGNSLASLPSDAFAGLANLKVLSLSGNSLTLPPADGLLAGSPLLRALDLSHNRLTQVSAGLFTNLAALAALNLTDAFTPCDCTSAAFRSWLDGAPAAQVKADWVGNPSRSCRCSSPPSLRGTAVVNVPAVAFVCTTSTMTSTPLPSSASAILSSVEASASKLPSSSGTIPASASAMIAASPSATAQAGQDSTTVPIGGTTLAIVLGCSIGAAVLLIIIVVTWAIRRQSLQRRQQRQPKAALVPVSVKPTTAIGEAGVKGRQPASGGGGGWLNGGYRNSPPAAESVDGDRRPSGAVQAKSSPSGDVERGPSGAPADVRPAAGYYERVAADLQQGGGSVSGGGAVRSPLKMNGLLPYAYTRQNSARLPPAGDARPKASLLQDATQPGDVDKASSLRFYSSHGALSPASASGRSPEAAAAADADRLYRSMRAPGRYTLPDRNAPLSSSLRFPATGWPLSAEARAVARSDADLASASAAADLAPPSRGISEPRLYDRTGRQATSPGNPFTAAGASAMAEDAMLNAPPSPRSAGWLTRGSTQFAFPPPQQHYVLPPPADYSTLGSSRSLSAASGSLASGGGGVGPHLADRVRFINDTPV